LTHEEEIVLIKKVLAGDGDAFEALMLDNQKKMYNLALKMSGNETDALDLSQEIFIKAYTSLSSFRMDCRFSVWLYRIAYNVCIDYTRKKKREMTIPLSYTDEDGDEEEFEVPDIRYSPETELEKKETREAIKKALDSLSPEHKQVIIMREFSSMSYTQIADVLGISEGTVKSRIARARTTLAKILAKSGTFPSSLSSNQMKGDGAND